MKIDISKLQMPAISSEGISAMELITSGEYNMPDLCKIISKDPVLSATLIKYANSSKYSQITAVKNIDRAINVLGIQDLGAAIIIASIRTFITPGNISQNLWEHSQAVANISSLIAKRYHPHLADDIELPALVHDMGALVLASNFPNEYSEIYQKAWDPVQKLTLSELEKEEFGVIHDDITTIFIEKYRLPKTVGEILADFHHRQPFSSVENNITQQQTAIINLAHYLDRTINNHFDHLNEIIPDSMQSLQIHLGLNDDIIENFIEDYDEFYQTEE